MKGFRESGDHPVKIQEGGYETAQNGEYVVEVNAAYQIPDDTGNKGDVSVTVVRFQMKHQQLKGSLSMAMRRAKQLGLKETTKQPDVTLLIGRCIYAYGPPESRRRGWFDGEDLGPVRCSCAVVFSHFLSLRRCMDG